MTDYTVKNGLSLFWGGPYSQWTFCDIEFNGIKFNCNEQMMMYLKALVHDDFEIAKKVLKEQDPSKQKKLGRQVKNFSEKKWNYEASMACVYTTNFCKYDQNEEFWDYLDKDLGFIIVEASPFDKVWGIGLGVENPKAWNRKTWQGENRLGKCITQVRDYKRLGSGNIEHAVEERHNLRLEFVKVVMDKMNLHK